MDCLEVAAWAARTLAGAILGALARRLWARLWRRKAPPPVKRATAGRLAALRRRRPT